MPKKHAKKDAAAIGIIGRPDEHTVAMLEKELGRPVRKIEKDKKIILLVGRGLFKKSLSSPWKIRSTRPDFALQ
jgi:hypothetical protein